MIRQAITCDICATEKKQTNHWFVAYEQSGELRLSGWSTRNRLRQGTKHLCGQTCLHKLVDDFMARSVASRVQAAADAAEAGEQAEATDASLTSSGAHEDFESSARLITAPAPAVRSFRTQAGLVAMPGGLMPEPDPLPAAALPAAAPPPAETPRYTSRAWRAEAWERERARELRASAHHPELARRRSSA